MIDSVLMLVITYYLQKSLQECRYKVKEKETKSFITDDLESSSDGDSREHSKENSD